MPRGRQTIISNGKNYRSQKHPLLEYIFNKYNPKNDTSIKVIRFTLADISEAYRNVVIHRIEEDGTRTRITEPASISNTILDLVRQPRRITSRLPDSIIALGYDLRKKTGASGDGYLNLAGEFVYVGVGNELGSWVIWPRTMERITLSSTGLPDLVKPHLRRDEGALFSVIDYCDVLSKALYNSHNLVLRVQHPLKWQPNEIDGFYVAMIDSVKTLFPIEAKALATHDEINLDQILGGVQTVNANMASLHAHIIPLAVKMIPNGIQIAVFTQCEAGDELDCVNIERSIEVTFNPPIRAWS